MIKTFIFAIILLAPLFSYAQSWVFVTSDESGHSIYVDMKTFKRDGQSVKYWQLNDSEISPISESGNSSLSTILYRETICDESKTRMIQFTTYSSNMAKGKVIQKVKNPDADDWMYSTKGTLLAEVVKFVCK